ncbi:hypothetical protein L218DRAFT_962280 [Marasmius fiardii PR-910]|nr:hypothetical protein L218DRAFT_962280 [Marasmius fiardii PR-910]
MTALEPRIKYIDLDTPLTTLNTTLSVMNIHPNVHFSMKDTTSHPRMEILTDATGITIDRTHFSSVGRDQNNYFTADYRILQKKRRRLGKDIPELSEFTEIKRGDIYKSKDVYYAQQLSSNRKDMTEAAVYHAEIHTAGSLGQGKFTIKTYRGQNAMKDWRHDFLICSKDWCRNVPLFGYNKESVPLLIFHGELVPLAYIEARLGYVGRYYISLLKGSLGCVVNQLWVDPVKGRFCRGPTGPQCHQRYFDYGANKITIPTDVGFLEEDVLIRYFSSMEYHHWFIEALGYSGRLEVTRDISASDYPQVISGPSNSKIASNVQSARWCSYRDSCLNEKRAIPNGITRFTLSRENQRYIEVTSIGERLAWLSQSLSVFHAHHVSLDEDLSNYKHICPYPKLTGAVQKSKCKQQRRQLYPLIYLFLLPFSFRRIHEDPLNAVFHWWSFDPSGQPVFSPEMCKYLGLPFKLCIKVDHHQLSWPTKIYKAIWDYQIAQGFDPETTKFAQTLGHSIYEVSGNRFEEVDEGSVCFSKACYNRVQPASADPIYFFSHFCGKNKVMPPTLEVTWNIQEERTQSPPIVRKVSISCLMFPRASCLGF